MKIPRVTFKALNAEFFTSQQCSSYPVLLTNWRTNSVFFLVNSVLFKMNIFFSFSQLNDDVQGSTAWLGPSDLGMTPCRVVAECSGGIRCLLFQGTYPP